MTTKLYEYRGLHSTRPLTLLDLGEMAASGWHLLAAIEHTGTLYYYFQRHCQLGSPDVGPQPAGSRSPGDPT